MGRPTPTATTGSRRRGPVLRACALSIGVVFAGCASSADSGTSPESVTSADPGTSADSGTSITSEQSSAGAPVDATITVAVDGPTLQFDRRLLGTNLPAWLGPERLADETLRAETIASGTTLVRMPGGSWSNAYDWSACELQTDACPWPWAARPSDFIDFVEATGVEAMWTASINHTAQSAAALVAFFNGEIDDDREIGPDRDGTDWSTVSFWAELRATGGHPNPTGINLWEIGNEVYGGKPQAGGSQCAGFGWETVWTCDGTEYVLGNEDHDGFLAIREAMITIDPSIEVGAVGVSEPESWSDWGNEVITAVGDALDFYVVHDYGFDESPTGERAIKRAGVMWPDVAEDVARALPSSVPIAITEYNLVSFEEGDTDQSMTTAMNALFIADTIGQLATSGVSIANQWNLANGVTSSGTDYGMLHADSYQRYPQFDAMAAWSKAGTLLHPIASTDDDLRVYPTSNDDGSWTIIAINLGERESNTSFIIEGLDPDTTVESRGVHANTLSDQTMLAFEATASSPIEPGRFDVLLPAWSIATIDVEPS